MTDDQDTIFYLNRLIREQRQKARQRAREVQEIHENSVNKFNRTQSSRRSARSLSFRRRSYRKGNAQGVSVISASDSTLTTNPAREEARLEAQYWRGETNTQQQQKQVQKANSSPEKHKQQPSPSNDVEKVNKAVVITNPNIRGPSPNDLYKTSRLNSQSPVQNLPSQPKSSPSRSHQKDSSCCVIL